jgi:YggT family protein
MVNYLAYFVQFLMIALEIYSWVFIIYILLSWFPVDPNNFLVKFIRGLCEPPYKFILRFLPPLRIGMFDFSIFYVIILIYLLRFLLQLLLRAII